MKRNDMLKIIADTIYNNTFRTSMLETLPLAEKVLDAIEQAGMLPPIHKEFIDITEGTFPIESTANSSIMILKSEWDNE